MTLPVSLQHTQKLNNNAISCIWWHFFKHLKFPLFWMAKYDWNLNELWFDQITTIKRLIHNNDRPNSASDCSFCVCVQWNYLSISSAEVKQVLCDGDMKNAADYSGSHWFLMRVKLTESLLRLAHALLIGGVNDVDHAVRFCIVLKQGKYDITD